MLKPSLIGLDHIKTGTDLIDEGQFGAPVMLTAYNYAQGQDGVGVELLRRATIAGPGRSTGISLSRAIGKDMDSRSSISPGTLAYSAVPLDPPGPYQAFDRFRRHRLYGERNTRNSTLLSADMVYGSGLRADRGPGADFPERCGGAGLLHVNGSIVQQLNFAGWHGASVRLDVYNLSTGPMSCARAKLACSRRNTGCAGQFSSVFRSVFK